MKVIQGGVFLLIMSSTEVVSSQLPNYELFLVERPTVSFIDSNNILQVSAYEISLSRKGNVRKDSLLIYEYNYDSIFRGMSGLDYNLTFQSQGPLYRSWYEFNRTYDTVFNLTQSKRINLYNKSGKRNKVILEKSSVDFLGRRVEKHFIRKMKYNNDDNLIYEYSTRIEQVENNIKSTLSKKTLYTVRPRIYDYEIYPNRIIQYETVDSSRIIGLDKLTEATCNYCHPKHINNIKDYNDKKQIVLWKSYTRDGELHTKRIYIYDDIGRIVQRIDSTGWYLGLNKNNESVRYDYKYLDNEIEMRKIYSDRFIYNKYDYNFNLIESYDYCDNESTNMSKYSIEYVNYGELTSCVITRIDHNMNITVMTYRYNKRGWLLSQEKKLNGGTKQLFRFYYN